MRSSSASLSSSRASRATCSTSCLLIMPAHSSCSELLELGVLERELLPADGGEAHRHERIAAAPLDADHEPLAPAAVADPSADLERQIVAPGVEPGLLRLDLARRWGAPAGAEHHQVLGGHLEEEP